MRWQDIKNSPDNTYFLFEKKQLFNKKFIEILKFHFPGIAAVKDDTGAYHINVSGKSIYAERYVRTFGFYCSKSAVTDGKNWFHINENGKRIYPENYAWIGNYQENLCSVRDFGNFYYHIDLSGNKIYKSNYSYCGDFKDGFACVKQRNGLFKHINRKGDFINDKEFIELGVFHKCIATAKDKNGWFHIDTCGRQMYSNRFANIEPFYNGQAKVELFDGNLEIINEAGETVLKI